VQCWSEHSIPLVTRDRDFRALAKAASLDVILETGSN